MGGAFFVRIGRTNPAPRSFPRETTRLSLYPRQKKHAITKGNAPKSRDFLPLKKEMQMKTTAEIRKRSSRVATPEPPAPH